MKRTFDLFKCFSKIEHIDLAHEIPRPINYVIKRRKLNDDNLNELPSIPLELLNCSSDDQGRILTNRVRDQETEIVKCDKEDSKSPTSLMYQHLSIDSICRKPKMLVVFSFAESNKV